MKAKIVSDGADRQSIRDKLKLCSDPLDPTSHPPTIVNIVSGQVADDTVNVQDAVAIGPLHDPVTWYKITHAGEQVAQWGGRSR